MGTCGCGYPGDEYVLHDDKGNILRDEFICRQCMDVMKISGRVFDRDISEGDNNKRCGTCRHIHAQTVNNPDPDRMGMNYGYHTIYRCSRATKTVGADVEINMANEKMFPVLRLQHDDSFLGSYLSRTKACRDAGWKDPTAPRKWFMEGI